MPPYTAAAAGGACGWTCSVTVGAACPLGQGAAVPLQLVGQHGLQQDDGQQLGVQQVVTGSQ